jgi:hypothetical protein
METMNYFQHDYRSRLDKKLLKIRMKHGWSGIGIYWALTEMLHEGNGFIEMDIETIAYELQCDEQVVKDVIEICFEYYESNVTCNRVIENLQFRREKASAKSKQATEAINKRWAEVRERNEYLKNTNGIPSVYEPNTKPIRNHTIEKEKEKEKEKGIDKDKLTAVYNAPDVSVIEDTDVDYMIDETDIELTRPMLERVMDKFLAIDGRFKFQSVMSEINEDYGGFDNLIEMYLPNDTSAQMNWKKQLQQYKNGIYA